MKSRLLSTVGVDAEVGDVGRRPHVFLPSPWSGDYLRVDQSVRHHLERVLRLQAGDPVTYTDGAGLTGSGFFEGDGVTRGPEERHPEQCREIVVAVAPPRSPRRARMIVEKLAELGVDRLVWLDAIRGSASPPRPERVRSWSIAALEQSRGIRLLDVQGPLPVRTEWPGHVVFVADRDGSSPQQALEAWRGAAVILVGPEGGFEEGEIDPTAIPVSFGPGVLRVETAVLAAGVLFAAARGCL